MKLKKALALMLALSLVILMSACAAKPTPAAETTAGQTTAAPTEAAKEPVTIKYVQQLQADESANEFYKQLMAQYEEASGNKVDFELIPEDQYRTWLTTQFAAGSGPDVYYAILYDAASDFGKGYLYNFNDAVKQENKYEPGMPWRDTISDVLMDRCVLSDTEVIGVPTTTSAVRIFYNVDLFRKAGIEKTPATWTEFMESLAKLKAAGVTPIAFPNATIADLNYLWFGNSVVSQLATKELLPKIDLNKNNFAEQNELAYAVDEGLLDFSSPAIQEAFKLMKDFSTNWNNDFNAMTQQDALEAFLRGDVAMTMTGSWQLRLIDGTEKSFEYGVMPVPTIMKDTSAFAQEQSVVLGGQPDGIMCVNKASSPEKIEAAIDFAMYMSSADIQAQKTENVYVLPTSQTVSLPETLKGFMITEDMLRIAYFTGINEEIRNVYHRGGQQYLAGDISLDEYSKTLNEAYKTVLDALKTENGWTKDNLYGTKK